MYDYYKFLEKLMANDGTKPPDRYQVFIRMARKYCHLMMLKCGGQGHASGSAATTKPGELAVACPACPRPGINLPANWENTPKEDRFIYIFELKDPGLGTGWSYMLENELYREYLLTVTDQKEMVTCSGLAALDYENTKFSCRYSMTGVGMGVCTRHEFIQLNGVGDLQKGERFANMDYIYDPLLPITTSYNILCIWWLFLMECLHELPPLIRCFLILPLMLFVIPKMHIKGHLPDCGILYSFNLTPGSGQTDGEEQEAVQQDALAAFSEQQQERVEGWKKMVHEYEKDPKKKNPYKTEVRLQFQNEEGLARKTQGDPERVHD
ncbi:hypothetical protein K438DRAFT_1953168 [Mycena galopus ATCC 62051]|nr:hypothetical protein K438DRAFT_1953168 [Mycena galopus ATCC 62051]